MKEPKRNLFYEFAIPGFDEWRIKIEIWDVRQKKYFSLPHENIKLNNTHNCRISTENESDQFKF